MAPKPLSWHVPVTVYTFNKDRYVLSGCFAYRVPMRALPPTLDCASTQQILCGNIELLKSALRAPAIVLCKGHQLTAFSAAGEEWPILPQMCDARSRVISAYEMKCVNLTTHIINYRLRGDGAIVLASAGEVNCGTCYVTESMSLRSLKHHLSARAEALKKTLRDRRLTVEIGRHRTCVYGMETMMMRKVIAEVDVEKKQL